MKVLILVIAVCALVLVAAGCKQKKNTVAAPAVDPAKVEVPKVDTPKAPEAPKAPEVPEVKK